MRFLFNFGLKVIKKKGENMKPIDIMKNMHEYANGYENCPREEGLKAKKLCFEYNNTSPDDFEKRGKILKELFGTYTRETFIEPSFHCDYGFNIHFHGMALINYNCVILDTSRVDIGASVYIAPGVCIACAGHSVDPEQRAKGIGTSKAIKIEDKVWIGANSTICGGVTIGSGSVIGAGSVVTSDIPANVVACGVPCKVIRKISEKDIIKDEDILF